MESTAHDEQLWNLQFNRWWGWNWLRKRKKLLSKTDLKEHTKRKSSIKCKKNENIRNTSRESTKNCTPKKLNRIMDSKRLLLASPEVCPTCNCEWCPLKLLYADVFTIPRVYNYVYTSKYSPTKCHYQRQDEFSSWLQNLPPFLTSSKRSKEETPKCKPNSIATINDMGYLLQRIQHLKKITELPGLTQSSSS